MRSKSLWVLCLLPVFSGLFFGGCSRQVANPTFPPTKTFTAVPAVSSTSTFTGTPALTSTFTTTATRTATSTYTASPTLGTPSNTFTPSSTSTPTVTPTVSSTPTNTDTTIPGSTDTFTFTVTATPTFTSTSTTTSTATTTSTSTVTSTATSTTLVSSACAVTINSFESTTENGSLSAPSTISSISYSTSYHTVGSQSLQVAVTQGMAGQMLQWGNFDPGRFTNVTQLVIDYTADASLFNGTYHQITLVAQSAASSKWWAPITVPTAITAGTGSVTFAIDWTQGTMTASDLISNLIFVWNTDSTGMGNFYFDNVRLVGTTTACPPSSCGVMNSFETTTENGTLSAPSTISSISYSTTYHTLGSQSLQVAVTQGMAGQMLQWGSFVPGRWTGATQIVIDYTADASLFNGTYHQITLVAQSSASSKWWAPVTVPTAITAGTGSVTFAIDWTQGTMTASDLISNLIFVWNTDSTGMGNFYFDNVRIYNGASCNP